MRLDRPTHIRKSNCSSGWMSEFTEEISDQINGGIERLGDGEYTFYSIYPLPADAAYDETVYPYEWIQTAGVAPDRLTVEIRRLDPDGFYRVYTIGRSSTAGESDATEAIHNGDNTYFVRPSEVLDTTEAISLFQHYYDHHDVPADFSLRQQPEFSIPAEDVPPEPEAPKAGLGKGADVSRTPLPGRRSSRAESDAAEASPEQSSAT